MCKFTDFKGFQRNNIYPCKCDVQLSLSTPLYQILGLLHFARWIAKSIAWADYDYSRTDHIHQIVDFMHWNPMKDIILGSIALDARVHPNFTTAFSKSLVEKCGILRFMVQNISSASSNRWSKPIHGRPSPHRSHIQIVLQPCGSSISGLISVHFSVSSGYVSTASLCWTTISVL